MNRSDLATLARRFAFFIMCLCLINSDPASAQNISTPPSVEAHARQVQVDLLAEKTAVRAGDKITLALRQRINPGWHTYWRNPGDSGEATAINWRLPPGATAGEIQWPLPEAIPVEPLMNYGYSDEVLLLTDITVPKDASGSTFEIAADTNWLVCKEICIPEEAPVKLSIPILPEGLSPRASPHAEKIAEAREKIPSPQPWPATVRAGSDGFHLKIDISGVEPVDSSSFRFFPYEWGQIKNAAPQPVSFDNGSASLQLAYGDIGSKMPDSLDGVLAIGIRNSEGQTERRGYAISAAKIGGDPILPATGAEQSPFGGGGSSGEATTGLSLGLALFFACIGGLILNLMPCVFPVLSLKAISLAKSDSLQNRRIRGTAYLAGVLVSCVLLAGILVALRAGGTAIGWGMQFQSPLFILTMMALFMALGLNMSGVFEIGGRFAGVGDALTRKAGLAGDFFTGVLAAVVATPCTAPFMGAAIGYAFSQPAFHIFAILLALGLGFALPIMVLSISPMLGRLLPKPGAWMTTFKQLMAFPLYATVGWLLWVLTIQQGSDGVLAGGVTLIGVALAAWFYGLRYDAGALRSAVAGGLAVAAIAGGALSLSSVPDVRTATNIAAATAGPKAEAFTKARLEELRSQKKAVFLNLTAAWCITCKVNEQVALRSDRLAEAFDRDNITYLVGDWTKGNPEITEILKNYGRAGVPLYLFYPASGANPEILPQLLTESIVLERIATISSQSNKQAKGEF